MNTPLYWGAVAPSTEATPGGRVMPVSLTSPAEAVFWLSLGYTITEYKNGTPVQVYTLETLGK